VHPEIVANGSRGFSRETISAQGPVLKSSVIDHGSKTLATVALVMGSVAFGGLIIFALLMPWIIAAETRAAGAEAITTAKVARTDSRMALDDVQRLREALMAKGFDVKKEH
jgi:hypothetical protein